MVILPPVTLALDTMLPVALTITELVLPLSTLPVTLRLARVPTPVAITPVSCDPLPKKNPPAMLAVVVILAADTKADITLPLRLNPAAFRLPLTTLPVALSVVAVITLAPVMLPPAPVVDKLPPEILPVTARLPSVPTEVMLVCAAVINVPAMLTPVKLPPVMLPNALTIPCVLMLPPVTLPVAITSP